MGCGQTPKCLPVLTPSGKPLKSGNLQLRFKKIASTPFPLYYRDFRPLPQSSMPYLPAITVMTLHNEGDILMTPFPTQDYLGSERLGLGTLFSQKLVTLLTKCPDASRAAGPCTSGENKLVALVSTFLLEETRDNVTEGKTEPQALDMKEEATSGPRPQSEGSWPGRGPGEAPSR